MSEAPPVLRVWRPDGGEYALEEVLSAVESLQFTPTLYDVGAWQVLMPYEGSALSVTRDSLFTLDWRGKRTTWLASKQGPARDEGGDVAFKAEGVGALALLARSEIWADPTRGILNQPEQPRDEPALFRGPAETVIRDLVAGNYVGRDGFPLHLPASQGRGANVRVRPKFDNLLEVVLAKARRAGLIVEVGLVNLGGADSTRSRLTLQMRTPEDLSRDVRLTTAAGTVTAWSMTDVVPTLTRAIVVDKDDANAKVRVRVTTPESEAVAAAWGGHWTKRIVGPGTRDEDELREVGEEAIAAGIGGRSLSITAAESEGMQAFTHYNVGDIATAELVPGAPVVEPITSIGVVLDHDGVKVTPTFGDPDSQQPLRRFNKLLRQVRREVRTLERD